MKLLTKILQLLGFRSKCCGKKIPIIIIIFLIGFAVWNLILEFIEPERQGQGQGQGQEIISRNDDKKIDAFRVGCWNWADYICENKTNYKQYKWLKEEKKLYGWRETEESKHCSKYFDSKSADVPITCINYFK